MAIRQISSPETVVNAKNAQKVAANKESGQKEKTKGVMQTGKMTEKKRQEREK
ncbi:hypothetical protein [Klebsiella sp. BIGb0407]|uniref:hypothetical protein n=1 Tax=Klebsiella sp. BIGb0407 TaxID=2940603 RepID=UPI002166FF39|nr:hypothetical protein [Klebsiella sp. BIGb0407]MCS3432423.1 hypothetical protein [Klebsiella sp. BIGb0407]